MFSNKLAGKDALDGWVHLFQSDFGQKTEPAMVDRQDRNLTVVQQPSGGQQRTVTTDNNRQVRLRCRFGRQRGFNIFALEPSNQFTGNPRNLRLLGLGNDNDTADIHDFLKNTKNSRLPSRPVIGDSHSSTK